MADGFNFGFDQGQTPAQSQNAQPPQDTQPVQSAQPAQSNGFDFGFDQGAKKQTPEKEEKPFPQWFQTGLEMANRYAVEPFEKTAGKFREEGARSAEELYGMVRSPSLFTHPFTALASGEAQKSAEQDPHVAGVLRAVGGTAAGVVGDVRNWPLLGSGALRPVFQKLMTGGFATMMAHGTYDQAKQLINDWDKLSPEQRAEGLTNTGLGAAMTAAAAHGAVGSEVRTAANKVFQSDSEAMKSASTMHESAKTVFDQRMHEADIARQQAEKATQDALAARQSESTGAGTAQQTIDAQEKASQAAANARKAQEALKQAGASRAEAGVEVDRLGRKLKKSAVGVTEKQTKSAAGAQEDFQKAIPSPANGPAKYDANDYQVGRRYLEQHHKNIQEVGSVQDAYDAFDHIQHDMENKVAPYVQKYANEPIATNVKMDVQDALAGNPRADFVEKGMQELEKYNLTDPTISESDAIRRQLVAENRATLKKNMWDVATALQVDPEFAARYAAVDSLRNGIYDTFEDKGVEGIRETRKDESSIIRLRNAAEKQLVKGEARVRGSGQSGSLRKAAAWAVQKGMTAGGAKVGGPVGAVLGDTWGEKLGRAIAPGDLTRNALIERSMRHQGGGVPVTEIQGPGVPASQFSAPGPVPQRENTPLHSELATHYGEHVADSSYHELEQRFMEDLADKQRHGVPLESPEKSLLGKINQQNAADALAAQQAAQEAAATGKSLTPKPTLPDEVEPLLHIPASKLDPMMDTHKGIVHDMAHIVVGSERGIDFPEGIFSHLHPANVLEKSLMSAPIDWSSFVDEDGKIDPEKIKGRMADLAATYVAGGVANDLYHDIPFTESHHLGADIKILKRFIKSAGFTETEASKLIAQAADDASQILSRPGVQDILEQHAAVREKGLNEKYHVSPERMEQILEDIKQHESTTGSAPGKSTGTAGAGKRAVKEAGAGTEVKPKEGDSAELRQATKGPAEGKGEGVRATEPAKPAESGLGTPPEEFKPIMRPEGGWGKDEPEDLLTSERQSPLKRDYKVEVIDQAGESKTETVPGFSSKDALKTAQKKFPGKASYVVDHPEAEPVNPTMKYSVPTNKTLSMPPSERSETHTMRHELGHAMVGLKEGMEPRGMYRHTHTEMPGIARAAVAWSMKGMTDMGTGRIKADKMPGVLRNLMGGIAADEAFNDLPRAANRNLDIRIRGGDGNQGYQILREAGYDHESAMSMLHQSIDQAKEHLTNPHVSDIIKENEAVREPGLSRQYHYSPERLRQMHLEAQRRINEQPGIDNRAVGAEGAEGRTADVAGREGGGPEASGPAATTQVAERLPKIENLRVPTEQTTGEHDAAIKQGGAIPGGIQEGEPDLGIPNYAIFHDPSTGSSLMLPVDKVTPENVASQLKKSRATYIAAEDRRALQTPELKQPEDMLRHELKTELGITGDDPRNGLPNKRLAEILKNKRTPELKKSVASEITPEKVPQHLSGIADDFQKQEGREPIVEKKLQVDPRQEQLADAYAAAKHEPDNPEVKKSYDSFKKDIDKQYNLLVKNGYTVKAMNTDPYEGDKLGEGGDQSGAETAYNNLRKDVVNNKNVTVWTGGAPPADHPLSEVDPKTGLTYNSKLRAIHDVFGHVVPDNGFDAAGEESAWHVHNQMFSPDSRPALNTETRAQTAYVTKHGEFANQKATILPKELQVRPEDLGQSESTENKSMPFWWNDQVDPNVFKGKTKGGQLIEDAAKNGGFTIHPRTGDIPTDGHTVETFPERRVELGHPPTSEDIRSFVAKNRPLFNEHPELHVGGYDNKASGKYELNVTGRYADKDAAVNAAKKLDQISAWDNAKKEEIPTGGTGKTTSFPEYPIEQRLADLSKKPGQGQLDIPEHDWKAGHEPEQTDLNTADLKSPKGSSVPLMENPLKIKGTGEGEKINTLDVAKALNKYTKKSLPALEMGKAEPAEQVERAKQLAEDEAKYQLHQNNSGKAWYTTDVAVHDDVLQRMRPELKDPAKLSLFKMAEAVLSSGQKPYQNLKAAVKAWDHYNETGEFPATNPNTGKSWGPRGAAAYGNALESINKLVQEKGEKGASEWLLSEHPVSELRKYNKGVSGKQTDSKLGAMILGEKRGPFAQNLHGIESAFTADMWVSRTWNRWMGTLDTKPTPDGDTASDAPKNNTERKLMSQSFEETAKKLGLTTSSLQAILWYYEQGLYDVHGSKKESWSFADAAKRVEKEHGEADKQQDQSNMFGEKEPERKPTAPAGQVHALDFMRLLGGKK